MGADELAQTAHVEVPDVIEHVDEVVWLSRNQKGELWLNAKPTKLADNQAELDETEEAAESSEGGEGEAEKKSGGRRGRSRPKKSEPKDSSDEKVES